MRPVDVNGRSSKRAGITPKPAEEGAISTANRGEARHVELHADGWLFDVPSVRVTLRGITAGSPGTSEWQAYVLFLAAVFMGLEKDLANTFQ